MKEIETMLHDVPARRGPKSLFGAPLTPDEKFLFDVARVLEGQASDRPRPASPPADASARSSRPFSDR